jgi:signal transduction histidine kinase
VPGLSRRDRFLIWTLIPLWLVCLAFHVHEVARTGLAQLPINAVPGSGPDAYPRVGSFRLETEAGGTGLELGDVLLRVGDVDLRGVGFIGFDAIAYEQAGSEMAAPLVYERSGQRRRAVIRPVPHFIPWFKIPAQLLMVPLTLLILLRAPGSRTARYCFTGVVFYALTQAQFYGGPRWQTWASALIWNFGSPLAVFLVFRWIIHFPEEMPGERRLSLRWAWIPALYWLGLRLNYMFGAPLPPEWVPRVSVGSNGLFMAQTIGILAWNYRHAHAIGRRRVKWAVLGGALVAASVAVTAAIPLFDPDFPWFEELNALAMLTWIAPALGFVIGILRYNLFDIDRLLSAAASASLLLGLVLAGMVLAVPAAASVLAPTLGMGTAPVQLLLAVALAVAIVPLQRTLRPRFDRLFFPEREALEHGIEALLVELSACADGGAVIEGAGRRTAELLRAEHGVTYLRRGDDFVPFRMQGRDAAPVFSADGALVRALADRQRVLSLQEEGLRAAGAEARALSALDARVVLPLRCGGEIEAFTAIGPKRSGDVYTSTDLSLLGRAAERASAELERHRDTEILREERRRARELEELKQAAEDADRAKSRFLAAASHDLRQPLHALGLFVEALEDRVGDGQERELVARVRRSTQALSEMFDALLDMSRLDAGAVEPDLRAVPLDPLLERLAQELAPSAREKGLALRVQPSGAAVRSDPVLLGRIVQNLMTNAVRYTERGEVSVTAERRDGALRLSVRDTGPGIPEAQHQEIFREFARLEDRPDGGLGLGLSIVQRLCAVLGHDLELDSKPGRGSCFSLRLPLAHPARESAERSVSDLGGRLVLVVEPDEAVLTGMRELLRGWGCDVLVATSTAEALAAQAVRGRAPDVVIAADSDAIAALRSVTGTALPALVVTADTTPERLRAIRLQGFVALAKPVLPPRLRAALSRLLEEARPGEEQPA